MCNDISLMVFIMTYKCGGNSVRLVVVRFKLELDRVVIDRLHLRVDFKPRLCPGCVLDGNEGAQVSGLLFSMFLVLLG